MKLLWGCCCSDAAAAELKIDVVLQVVVLVLL
jgi:hypothetical protein